MQPHLRGLGLENFRVFADYQWFDFAPITILTGPNSSGKSSVLKALLLLADNYIKNKIPKTLSWFHFFSNLAFDGESHELSSGNNVINKTLSLEDVRFSFPYKLQKIDNECTLKYSYRLEKKSLIFNEVQIFVDQKMCLFTYSKESIFFDLPLFIEIVRQADIKNYSKTRLESRENDINTDDEIPRGKLKKIADTSQRDNLISVFSNKDWNISEAKFTDFYDTLQDYFVWDNGEEDKETFEHYLNNQNFEMALTRLLALNFGLKDPDKESYPDLNGGDTEIESALSFIFNSLGITSLSELSSKRNKQPDHRIFDIFSKIDYLPSIKGVSKRVYQRNESHILNSLIKEYTIKDNYRDISEKDELTEEIRGIFEKLKNAHPLHGFLNKWTKAFNLAPIKIHHDDLLDISYITIGEQSLTDLGFGISQITALLLKLAPFTQEYDRNHIESLILLLEEPESNLHPKFQSQLANLFLDAKKRFQHQFIIETHSEYMIRKFQYLVAKGEMKPEDVVIYYLHDPNDIPEGEKQVKKIEILSDGSLSDEFGPGFFDEATNWKFELLRLKNAQKN